MAGKIIQTAGRDALGAFAPEFTHLAIEVLEENGPNEQLEAVSDEEYGRLK